MSPAELAELTELESAIDALPSRIADTLTPVVKRLIAEAVAAERERCAERVEARACQLDRPECCGYSTSHAECCSDPLYMISSRDAAWAIRNPDERDPSIPRTLVITDSKPQLPEDKEFPF